MDQYLAIRKAVLKRQNMKSSYHTPNQSRDDFTRSAFESQMSISQDYNPNNISSLNRSYLHQQNNSACFYPQESVKKERKYLPGYEIEEQETPGNFDGLNISNYENRNFEDSGVTPQKAKFFFCALQKFARKSLWSTVIKRIQHYNSTNSRCNDPYLRQQTSTYQQTSTSYYTKTYEQEEEYLGGHHHNHDDHENHEYIY